jgi:hypothetical protein
MSKLVDLLLQGGARNQEALMNEASSLFNAAAQRVYSAVQPEGGLVGGDTFMPELCKTLSLQLEGINLLGDDYKRIYDALDLWVIKNSLAVDDEREEKALMESVRVRDVLKDLLLPALRIQQQIIALKKESANYIEHLRVQIVKMQAEDPTSASLTLLKNKHQAMINVAQTLETSQTPEEQLAQFKFELKGKKGILGRRRYDFTERTLYKAIVTILTLSGAYWWGIWKSEGAKATEKMEAIAENLLPERQPARRHPHRRPKGG